MTHDQIEALALGDRIAVLDHGHMHQLGTPAAVYQWPADRFVATFIGSPPMNLVAAGKVEIGFRPEHFLPREVFAVAEPLQDYPLNIVRIENLGSDRLVYGLLEPPQPPVKVISRIPCTVNLTLQAGTRHPFAVRRADLRRFDASSGASLDSAAP